MNCISCKDSVFLLYRNSNCEANYTEYIRSDPIKGSLFAFIGKNEGFKRGRDMRKAQKQEILEIVQTLHQAHDEIKKYIETNNIQPALDMLGQCQKCAISIGTAIENSEGEGFVTVEYIEKYCDIVYQIHEKLNNSNADVNINKTHKLLKKQLLCVENSIKNDIRIKRIAVFLPYKVSMWDSLESI